MSLQSGATNPSNHVFLNIATYEEDRDQDCKRSFWLFVDLKEGLTVDRVKKLTNPNERDWIAEKLAIAGIDIESESITGFGSKVFDQIASHNQHLADLRRTTRCKAWREVFFQFLDYLLWIFAGGRRIVT